MGIVKEIISAIKMKNSTEIIEIFIGLPLRLKYKIFGNPKCKQELLFRMALKEKGFNVKKLKISCNHLLGFNFVNGLQFGIKYPESFYMQAINLIPNTKDLNFYFNGNMKDYGGERKILLEPFKFIDKSEIIESEDGRIRENKDKFNIEFFTKLASAKFGLSPHHPNWPGDMNYLWTYRFIESCFVDCIPVLFKKAPLTDNFVHDFRYIWDDEILKNPNQIINSYSIEDAKYNRELALERFCINEEECKLIKQSIKKSFFKIKYNQKII
jgi:hypothetical protein